MAEKCICCGKKIGLLNGSHLNNQVCDSCYFPIGGFLSAIKESYDMQTIENNYNQFMYKVQSSAYCEVGKEYLMKVADKFVENNKAAIQIKIRNKQLKEGFLVTTSNKFEKYEIIKYYGIASGSTVLGTGIFSELNAVGSDFFGTESNAFADKLDQARTSSINKMIDKAISQGGNALIGVSFDYINFTSNMIGVVANGTVVEIVEQTV
ncbi:MAG: heavy metal-binding domain-containing protein [Lachnospiraceae bacterium]|nr:heavy metal-binding domain-containing protein [Lachnospiraceae bacterium]